MQLQRVQFLPAAISLYITYRCYLQCPHCLWVQSDLLNKHELSLDQVKEVIDDAAAHQVFLLILSGGEPLMHPDIDAILLYARSRKILPLLAITGIRISDQQIDGIVRAGIPSVQVSLDGLDAQSHDALRGQGTFDEVILNVQRLQRRGILVNVAICVHRSNLNDLPGFFARMWALQVARVKMAFYRPFGTEEKCEALDQAEKDQALGAAREFMQAVAGNGWIGCPTHDLTTSTELRSGRRHPPLAIGADGVLSEGEGGFLIGRLQQARPSGLYTQFVAEKIRSFFERLIQALQVQYSVGEVTVVEASFYPDALVYRWGQVYSILVKKDLPLAWHYFILLHEIGHVATGTLVKDPTHAPAANEERANRWALNTLRPHLEGAALPLYEAAVVAGYGALRELVIVRLFRDLIRYC